MTVSQAVVRAVQPVWIWLMTTVAHALQDGVERIVIHMTPMPTKDNYIYTLAFLS